MKICTKCRKSKPISEFTRLARMADGLDYQCKSCKAESMRAWRAANKEKIAEYRRKYCAANKEGEAARIRAWRTANRERRAAYSRAYGIANKERKRAWNVAHQESEAERKRAWRAANPDSVRAEKQRRRARKSSAEGICTKQDIRAQYEAQKGRCYYAACGHAKLGNTYHVDHVVPLSRGGSNGPENLVIACPHCNNSKGTKLPHEWIEGGRLL